MPPLQQSYKLNCFCLKFLTIPRNTSVSFPLPKFSFLFLLPNIGNAISHSCSHPLINLGGGGQCALVDCPTLLTLICIFWFLYLSVVSQFAKFCKLWARQRRQVFLCVTICKILQIVNQTTTTRFPFFEALLVNQTSHFLPE